LISFVLDASVAGSWLGDELPTGISEELRNRTLNREAIVPALFPFEMANVALSKLRSLKIADQDFIFELLKDWRVQVDPQEPTYAGILRIAIECGISAYDAAYLELAKRRGLPLATFDKALRKAAKHIGVKVLK
jgi:predicted nucleic acid-binding protein